MEKIWKTVKGFEDYEVSNDGSVRRCKPLFMPNGALKFPAGKVLKPKVWNKNRYHIYRLHNNQKTKTFYAHKIVALAFLSEPPSLKHEVCHNDGNRRNNHILNLRWGTHKENMEDMTRHKNIKK